MIYEEGDDEPVTTFQAIVIGLWLLIVVISIFV